MRSNAKFNLLLSWTCVMPFFFNCCKEPFIPPAGIKSPSWLVVNGFLNAGNDSTTIELSRTRSLDSGQYSQPELKAQVSLLAESGTIYSLFEQNNGRYSAAALNLNPGDKYQLEILTKDGRKYLSDPVSVVLTPPIDSVSWKMDSTGADSKLGVTIYANTHDPSNTTWYYRWDFEETWEYHTVYVSWNYYYDGQVLPRDVDSLIFTCWKSAPSSNLTLASSTKLSQDIIFENPLVFIPKGDQKLGVNYSILVRQSGITREAFEYWENLKKNTELTGTIFDAQPSQIEGNIHCLSDPDEKVLGYLSASTIRQDRIFVDNKQLPHWNYQTQPVKGCNQIIVTGDSIDYYFGARGYVPLFLLPPPPLSPRYWGTLPECVDCRLQGGKIEKPIFWQ